jgi:hypothetical protein
MKAYEKFPLINCVKILGNDMNSDGQAVKIFFETA